MAAVPVLELTREQIVAQLETGARSRRRVSAVELVRRHRNGQLADPGEVADLLVLADLLAEDDEIFSGR